MDTGEYKPLMTTATGIHSNAGKPHWSKCCALTTIIVALILVGTTAFVGVALCLSSVHNLPTGPMLGHRKDTIELAKIERFSHSQLSVSTCDIAGDSQHTNNIYVVNTNNLIEHQGTSDFESLQFDQPDPSATSALVDYLYLLKGSKISYTLCLGSTSTDKKSGTLFLFDDDLKYYKYEDSPEFGEELAVLSIKLTIGSSNATECLTISYEAPKSAYYFIAARTPGSIFYTFNYTAQVNYYSRKDYKQTCSIYDGYPCEINLPGSLFSTEEYVILAYIEPNVEVSAKKNHLCISSSGQSESISLIVGICGSVGGLAILSVVVIVILSVAIRLYKNRNRKGYVSIQDHPPPYYSHYKA